jgi:acyl-CoA thioesterase FadM
MTLGMTLSRDETITAHGTLTVSFYDIQEREATPIPEDIRQSLDELAEENSPSLSRP